VLAWLLGPAVCSLAAPAHTAARVQELSGYLDTQDALIYELSGLRKGETLYVYAEGTSGNLDPSVGVLKPTVDVATAREQFRTGRDKILADQPESPQAFAPLFGKYFLSWDDDSGAGYAARLKLVIPADGDYRLVLGSSPLRPSFGGYRLLLGLDAPQVLGDVATSTGDTLARLRQAVWQGERRVQEISGTVLPGQESASVELQRIFSGETLCIVLETTPGATAPGMVLYDYGDKPLAAVPAGAHDGRVTLQYTFEEMDENPRLKIKRAPGTGDAAIGFRLRAGVNATDVLTGQAAPTGKPIVRPVTTVEVGLRLDQITGVDQRPENFGVVAGLLLKWQDPCLLSTRKAANAG